MASRDSNESENPRSQRGQARKSVTHVPAAIGVSTLSGQQQFGGAQAANQGFRCVPGQQSTGASTFTPNVTASELIGSPNWPVQIPQPPQNYPAYYGMGAGLPSSMTPGGNLFLGFPGTNTVNSLGQDSYHHSHLRGTTSISQPPVTPPVPKISTPFHAASATSMPGSSSTASNRTRGPGQAAFTGSNRNMDTPPQVPNSSSGLFKNSREAREYLDRPIWRPKSGNHGVPMSERQRSHHVMVIRNALISIDRVKDSEDWPGEFAKFQPNTGEWSNPLDIEAIAHKVVDVAISIHRRGVTGLQFRCNPILQEFTETDTILTFTERIYLMHILLKHYKLRASFVMRQENIEHYLARIWSTLGDEMTFTNVWANMDERERMQLLWVRPYFGTNILPPTETERMQWQAGYRYEAAQRQRVSGIPPSQQGHYNQAPYSGGLSGGVPRNPPTISTPFTPSSHPTPSSEVRGKRPTQDKHEPPDSNPSKRRSQQKNAKTRYHEEMARHHQHQASQQMPVANPTVAPATASATAPTTASVSATTSTSALQQTPAKPIDEADPGVNFNSFFTNG